MEKQDLDDFVFVRDALAELDCILVTLASIRFRSQFTDDDARAALREIRHSAVHAQWALGDDSAIGGCVCHMSRAAYRRQLLREVGDELDRLVKQSEAVEAKAMRERFNTGDSE